MSVWGDGDLGRRTSGLCLRLGEGERRRRGDGDLRRRGDWLLRCCADAWRRGDDDVSRPRPCLASDSPCPRGDLDFDLLRRRGDFRSLFREAPRALGEPDLSRRRGDLDLDLSFLRGDRDLDLNNSTYTLLSALYNIFTFSQSILQNLSVMGGVTPQPCQWLITGSRWTAAAVVTVATWTTEWGDEEEWQLPVQWVHGRMSKPNAAVSDDGL